MFYNKNTQTISDSLPDYLVLSNGTVITGPVTDTNIISDAGYFIVRNDTPTCPPNHVEDIDNRQITIDTPYVDIIRSWIPSNITPPTISARQIRLWLIDNNISLSGVENAINGIIDEKLREKTLVEWEYAPYVERNHPLLNTLGEVLGLSSEQIDQAFSQAAQL